MPKINHEEYEVLKGLDDKWKWIARDSEGEMYTYVKEPYKDGGLQHWRNCTYDWKRFEDNLFQFIQGEDSEPYNIAELIGEYESEEKEMKKDIEWLKEEIENMSHTRMKREGMQDYISISKSGVLELINQLDEPEVLSQEWIDEHEIHYNHWVGAVPVTVLQNLLVPKQEITEEQAWNKIAEYYPDTRAGLQSILEHFYYGGFTTDVVAKKPVIPQFVAKFIERYKARTDLEMWHVVDWLASDDYEENEELTVWYRENSTTFARAWLDGFTVEEEQKYKVELPTERLHHILTMHGDGKGHFFWKEHINNFWYRTHLTEQEIKAIDERFWAFAVKVEELEE